MNYKQLLEKSKTDHKEFIENWSGQERQTINNDPKKFDDLWTAHEEVGLIGQILFSISRVETNINEIIRNYYIFKKEKLVKFNLIKKINFYIEKIKWEKIEKIAYKNRYFGADIGLSDKIKILTKIGKELRRGNHRNMNHYLADYRKLRNIIAHSELTYCNTRNERFLIYRMQGADYTYHIALNDYSNALQSNLKKTFPILMDWFSLGFKDIIRLGKAC